MSGWMRAVQNVPAPAGRRRLLRSLAVAAVVVSGAAAPVALSGAVAAAEEAPGRTVVGELVQAWAEASPGEAAAGHGAEELVSWVRPAGGDPVHIESAAVDGVPSGSTVSVTVGAPVTGSSATGTDALHSVLGTSVVESAGTGAAAAPAPATNEVTVAMVAPAGSAATGDGTSLRQVVSAVDDRVGPFWSEQSGGAISLRVTATHDWAQATVGCADPGLLWDEVAARVKFVPGPGKHLLLYVGRAAGCAYALAEVGTAPSSGGRLYVSDTSTSALAHEFGHNFGLGHSSAQQCEGAIEGGHCRTVAYRDPYDVMGVSWAQLGSLNAPQAARLKVLPAAAQQAVPLAEGGATTATLAPLSGGTGTRALRLTDAEGVDYWLEYRTPTFRDEWLTTTADGYGLDAGVLLRRAGGMPDTSILLDGTPGTAGTWDGDFQAALPVGVPVSISGGDFTVVLRGLTAEGAVLDVTPTPPAAGSAPAPAAPRAAPRGGVMSGSAASVEPAAPEAAAGEGTFWAPEYVRAAHREAPDLETASGMTTADGLLVAAAASVLAGATLLLVRHLRTRALRGR